MTEDNKYWYLRNHKLFDQLSKNEVEDLCIISHMKSAEKNDIIFFSESEVKKIFILKYGTVKICREDKYGKEIITEMLTEGDIFGHINASSTKIEYAKVLSDQVKLCFFEIDNFKSVLKNNPNLSLKYADAVNEKLISFQQKYEDLIFKDVDTRVLDFFKNYASHHGKVTGNMVEMEMMLTHQDIADYTASSRQSVTTIINKLVEKGKIVYEGRKKVIIPNIKDL
ncbi:Crp/Fnr family transcriptional regulator [Aurantibacillus circumpalustris]|uniref:Crp/Fnr family transcriptional regulator n=1 Tax=Aurantibacillus circumpalustris TaxID=3036359 RepID=UPI00295BD552|nr:Crp/Fnr family transcriptional regulator [Aurantibacillus circumpalustris]